MLPVSESARITLPQSPQERVAAMRLHRQPRRALPR